MADRVGVSEGAVYLDAKRFTEAAGDVEARVIGLACATPPAGCERRSLRLLEKQVVLTDGMPPPDHSTIGRVLKTGCPLGMPKDSGHHHRPERHPDPPAKISESKDKPQLTSQP